MHRGEPLPDEVLARATRQLEVLSRSQLTRSGLVDCQIARLIRQQTLTRTDSGVYLLGSREPTWPQHAWAAHLMGGRESRLLGRSAGAP